MEIRLHRWACGRLYTFATNRKTLISDVHALSGFGVLQSTGFSAGQRFYFPSMTMIISENKSIVRWLGVPELLV